MLMKLYIYLKKINNNTINSNPLNPSISTNIIVLIHIFESIIKSMVVSN